MTKRIAISNIVLALSIGALSLFYLLPTFRDVRKLHQTISEERAILEFRYANRQALRHILENVERLYGELPALRALAVPEGTELAFIKEIETRAARSGLTPEIRVDQPTEKGPAGYGRRMRITVSAAGPFTGIGTFVEDLERLPNVFLEPTITVTASGDHGETARIVYQADVSWPRQTN